MNPLRKLFFKDKVIRTFFITRLQEKQVQESVFLKNGSHSVDVTKHHAMICLDPFCVAAWLTNEEAAMIDPQKVKLQFKVKTRLNAEINVSFIERIPTPNGQLVLYKIDGVRNHQMGPFHRLALFGYFLRSKTNTFYSRRVISALYSYPRRIIIVSYSDDTYHNIFPMDIQGFIAEENMYLLGLRTTNITLDKILEAKKVVVCDTDTIDLETVYRLGKHSSKSPAGKNELPFGLTKSEKFGFPVPDFTGSYKEIEIIRHKKMGYHMLMIGKVVHTKQIKTNPASLYHVGFLQFKKSGYPAIDGLY
jgi:flavin reductase (DIM6/NTAB) family NADH-FMN oxidoreductase RutF